LVIARSADGRSNVAVTDFAVSIVTTHEPVPEHPAPDQLAKVDPLAEIASNVTAAPGAKAKAHVPPQLIPLGVLMTVPVPVPAFVTVNVWLRGTVTVNEANADTLLGSVKADGDHVRRSDIPRAWCPRERTGERLAADGGRYRTE